MLLALTVFAGKAAVQGLGLVSTTMWLYNPAAGDPDDENAYTPATSGQEADCEGVAEVCAISAPELNGRPDLDADPSLRQALQNGDAHESITFGPYNP